MSNKSAQRYCPHCGHKIDKDTKYCPHCGYKIPSINMAKNEANHKAGNSSKLSRVAKNDNDPSTDNPIHQWFSKTNNQIATGVIVLLLLGGIGLSIHHNDTVHQQQQTTQQQSNQNNNQNNQTNQPKQTKRQRAEQVTGNLLNDVGDFTSNGGIVEQQDPNNYHKFYKRINKGKLSQYYLHGTDNPYFKQMLKWCENQYKGHTVVNAVGRDFHMHHITGNKYAETYRVYYCFGHHYLDKNIPDEGMTNREGTHDTYQTTVWHTIVKRIWNDGRYRWFIVKSNSSKHVTRPSNSVLVKVGLRNPGQNSNDL